MLLLTLTRDSNSTEYEVTEFGTGELTTTDVGILGFIYEPAGGGGWREEERRGGAERRSGEERKKDRFH